MSRGPVSYLVIEFPGNQFKGEIMPALNDLVDAGLIRIMDLVVIKKDRDGNVNTLEMSSLDANEATAFQGFRADYLGLFNDEDLAILADTLDNNSSAGILLFENVWATRFTDAVANANGRWVLMESVPKEVLTEALAAAGADWE